jgi:hypothetical protein
MEKFLPNFKLKLREQPVEVMRFKHYSHCTESAYWHYWECGVRWMRERPDLEFFPLAPARVLKYL